MSKISKIKDYIENNAILKRIMNGIIMGVGGAVISKVLLTLFNIILARVLTVEAYGAYSLINNTVQTFTIFAGAGIGVTLTRYVALYREKDNKLAGVLIGTLLLINVLTSMLISILVFIFADKIALMLNSKIQIENLIRITAFTIFFTAIVSILQGTLQGFESYRQIAKTQIISNLFNIILGILMAKLFGIIGSIYSLLILQLIMLIFMVYDLFKNMKKYEIYIKVKMNSTIKEAITKVMIPSFFATIFILPVMWITNFYFSSNIGLEEFAVFSVCLQWFNIINYIPQQLGQLKPIYTQLYNDKKYTEMRRYNNKIIIITILFTIGCTILLFFAKGIILKSYGEYYEQYTKAFTIMIISTILFAIQSQYGSVFQAIGKSWLCFALNLIWSASYIVAFFLLYHIGVVGYAYTYLISYLIYAVVSSIAFYIVINRKELKVSEENINITTNMDK